jgi:transcriptional regulator with XRE-family HTH domain
LSAVETAGGPEVFDDEVQRLRDQARGWRLAELRKRRGLSQAQVARRISISVSRVSEIEKGDVSTRDVLDRYIAALGGTFEPCRRLRRRTTQGRLVSAPTGL